MAYYDYNCSACGPFSEQRPMAECALPADCPSCGSPAPRAFLRMPATAMMAAERRTAFSVNERASHEPKSTRATGAHAPGCACCGSAKAKSKMLYHPNGAKMAPSARPWMIGH